MKTIVEMEFGSTVYGTKLPTSDTDYKRVVLPSAKDILMQKAIFVNHEKTNQTDNKNSPDDIDIETFSIQRYLQLLLEGQTVTIDMLFVPPKHYREANDIWQYITENKHQFLHSGVSAFVGYCRTQANKYGIRGSRMGAVKKALLFLSCNANKQLTIGELDFKGILDGKYISIVDHIGADKTLSPHFEVCNRKFSMRTKIEYAIECLEKVYASYGHRARLAEQNQGIDWKALMHAVRIKNQAIELLTTGNVTFPRPEKDHLLKIRTGELPYDQVAHEIEEGLTEVESVKSRLPERPNYHFCESLICGLYKREIMDF